MCEFEDCNDPVHARGYCGRHYAQMRERGLLPVARLTTRGWSTERRLAHFSEPRSNGCVEWTGTTSNGYGTVWDDGRQRPAHRAAYEMHIGQRLFPNLHVDHICVNSGCVNPFHMQVVSARQNCMLMQVRRGNNRRHAAERLRRAGLKIWLDEIGPERNFAPGVDKGQVVGLQ